MQCDGSCRDWPLKTREDIVAYIAHLKEMHRIRHPNQTEQTEKAS